MLIKRIVAGLVIPMLMVFAFTGCWDRKELNEVGIVMALGIDKDCKNGMIHLTSQVVRPSELKKQGGSMEPSYDLVTTTNETVFEAIRDTVKKFDRRSIFSHVKVIVIGENMAREGLTEVIDFITRTHEIRSFTWIMIAKDSEAKDVLGVKRGIEKIQANYMAGIIKRGSKYVDETATSIIEFIKKTPGEGIQPVSGVFELEKESCEPPQEKKLTQNESKILALAGTAVFKKNKLVGYLNTEETRGFNILTKKKDNAAIHVASPINKDSHISIEVKSIKSNIKPEIREGKIYFNINVKAEGNITEDEDNIDISNVEIFYMVNEKFKEYVKKEVSISVDKIQKDLKTDVLGLGDVFQRKFPKEWNSIKDQWDTVFPETVCEINVDTRLVRTGLFLKPVNAKEVKE